MRKFIVGLLICICIGIMGYSGYQLYTLYSEYHEGDVEYKDLEQFVSQGTQTAEIEIGVPATPLSQGEGTGDSTEGNSTDETTKIQVTFPEVDVEGFADRNEDFVGYLICDDTHISYPVVRGDDNEFYLHHTFDKTYNFAGCLFLESTNMPDFSDFNSIIYGHHMKNGSMFRDLAKYKDQSFFDEHPYMLFMTPNMNYAVQIFAGFVSKTTEDSWQLGFTDDAEKQKWIDSLIERSMFRSTLRPTAADHILTLSTCSYEFKNARFVVYGILTPVAPPAASE